MTRRIVKAENAAKLAHLNGFMAGWVAEYRFHPTRRWRFDFANLERMIAVEVEGGVWTGGRHTRGKGFEGDIEKYNCGVALGWRILRTTPANFYKSALLDLISSTVDHYAS